MVKLKIVDIFRLRHITHILCEELTLDQSANIKNHNNAYVFKDEEKIGSYITSSGKVFFSYRTLNPPKYFSFATKDEVNLESQQCQTENWYLKFE
ncbi:hypothetical protein [Bartonella sp. HY038]|uniref:hypothetical protein n=1 Tax=Bartonella sp. HY038 TaxID=2759660 RepID=UPI0015F7F0D4|nr:hypothetical protein [Bartonella sp. HY038]